MKLEEDMSAKDWLKEAGLTWERHLDGRRLKGISVHSSEGQRMHKAPYCTADGAVAIAKKEIQSS